jgi:hypothetical protein
MQPQTLKRLSGMSKSPAEINPQKKKRNDFVQERISSTLDFPRRVKQFAVGLTH